VPENISPLDLNKRPTKLPLIDLRDRYKRDSRGTDVLVLATQLGIVPDLRYLIDGLQRSRSCLTSYGSELADCLRAVPGSRLEPDELVEEIDHLIRWAETQGWAMEDKRRLPMARASATSPHPLSGYCLSVAFHWGNLFYTLEPAGNSHVPGEPSHQPYENVMEEFSTYVLAAQSTVDPDDYLAFCKTWWSNDMLPARPPFPDRRLASRVANASRAMRRITLVNHRDLFHALTDLTSGDPFHARVSNALRSRWSDPEQLALSAITLLLEEVRVGWRRPGIRARHGGAARRATSTRSVHQKLLDGYVRVAESNAILLTYSTDGGLAIEAMLPSPMSIESLAQDLMGELGIETDEDAELEDGDSLSERAESRAKLSARKREEAAKLLDGTEWLPADDAAGEDIIESVIVGPATGALDASAGGIHPASSSRWASEHVRRYHFAHGLTKDRLTKDDVKYLLRVMRDEPSDSPNGPALLCLHASIALGRPFDEATSLVVHTKKPHWSKLPESIHYVLETRQWWIPAPPAAWLHKPQDAHDERVQWSQIWLNDATGFHELVRHFGRAVDGQPVKQMKTSRRQAVEQWIRRTLPSTDASLHSCSDFLFHRLLAISRGDLGMARLITSHEHSHGRSIWHYAHYEAPRVWHAYRSAWSSTPFPYTGSSSQLDTHPGSTPRGRGYGAKRVPTLEAVRRLFTFLHAQVKSGHGAERENAYTAYTLAGLTLGLGMRPVVEPKLMNFGDSIADLLVVTFLDKARTDYHRRTNAVPRTLATHLEHYSSHLRIRDRCRNLTEPLPLVFGFTDPETGVRERFRPSHFVALAKPVFELELYSLRRFARTRLIEEPAVHGEDLDAYMGHWFDRVSPHDALSTYPMMRLQQFARGPVDCMLRDVGFKSVKIKA
jgi:hypothetical protein